MGLNLSYKVPLAISFMLLFGSCNLKKSKSDLEIVFTNDTLAIGHTYWWSQKKPFSTYCSEEHSLIFTGTITDLMEPNTELEHLYTSQEGHIKIERLYKIKDIGKNIYAEQNFISTDCFFGSELKKGDTVLVFCYDYEQNYSIPGKECIIKINGFDDPLITSVRKFIDANDNPTVLKKDIKVWGNYGLGDALEANIECYLDRKNVLGD